MFELFLIMEAKKRQEEFFAKLILTFLFIGICIGFGIYYFIRGN